MGLPVGPPQGGTPLLPSPGQPAPMQPGEFKTNSIPALATFNINNIPPPSNLYIGRDDVLLLQGFTNQATDTVTINIRTVNATNPAAVGGQPDTPAPPPTTSGKALTNIDFGTVDLPLVQGVLASKIFPLTEGFLLSVAGVGRTTAARGITFLRATLVRGGTTIIFGNLVLVSDYVSNFFAAGWPVGRITTSRDGHGFITSVTVANPAAGADWTYTPPLGAADRVLSVSALYTASAAAANRVPRLQIQSGTLAYSGSPNQVIIANATVQVTGSGVVPTSVLNSTDVMVALPLPIFIPPGMTLGSATQNIQGADTWTNIRVTIERFCALD